jgi:hypothetical protein
LAYRIIAWRKFDVLGLPEIIVGTIRELQHCDTNFLAFRTPATAAKFRYWFFALLSRRGGRLGVLLSLRGGASITCRHLHG